MYNYTICIYTNSVYDVDGEKILICYIMYHRIFLGQSHFYDFL